MNNFDLLLVVLFGLLFLKESKEISREQRELRTRITKLAEKIHEKDLSYLYISDDFLLELKSNYEKDETRALVMLQEKTKLDLEDTKAYLYRLMEE